MTPEQRIARLTETIPQVLEDLRALRAEVIRTEHARELQTWTKSRYANPILSTCNDLAIAAMAIGDMPLIVPPQRSGRGMQGPDPEQLAAAWQRWLRDIAAPGPVDPAAPIVGQQVGRKY
ncbi:MAG: hypothetical protein KJ011_03265 [Burkholderiaceae bacterium]|nr:hypothetical protein [Burkholderiaceae bacterium]